MRKMGELATEGTWYIVKGTGYMVKLCVKGAVKGTGNIVKLSIEGVGHIVQFDVEGTELLIKVRFRQITWAYSNKDDAKNRT